MGTDLPEPIRRVAIVTPYAWGTPHPVNDHVAELAAGLCELAQSGTPAPEVVVLAPSLDPRARRATRRALREIGRGDDVAGVLLEDDLRASVPGARRAEPELPFPLLALGVPIGAASVAQRASLRLVMERGGVDILHVHDPLESDLTRFALKHWPGLTVATFHHAPERSVVDAFSKRERILDQIDRWLLGADIAPQLADAGVSVPEDARRVPVLALHASQDGTAPAPAPAPAGPARTIVVGRGSDDDAHVRTLVRALDPLAAADPELRLELLTRSGDHHRPRATRSWRGRMDAPAAGTREAADAFLARASVFIGLPGTARRLVLEARAAGLPIVGFDPREPALAVAATEQALAAGVRIPAAPGDGIASGRASLAQAHLEAWEEVAGRRQVHIAPPALAERTCAIDLHMHTNHSWDCATDPEALLYVARKVGLTAVAVTDHNEVSGALACAELGPEYGIQVIVGEEVKTSQGEVIGLFLTERIEPGLTWEETIREIRRQDGLVYVPHPFDRLHTIPDIGTLRDTIDEIDAFEVWNARLAFEQYNRDAQRFARKYNLLEGAGSDAHVVQGLGTAAVHMPAWDDPESFLTSLGRGEIIRRPKSLLYLQGLKWINDLTGRSKGSPMDAVEVDAPE